MEKAHAQANQEEAGVRTGSGSYTAWGSPNPDSTAANVGGASNSSRAEASFTEG